MSKTQILRPSAAALMESMRDLGYSLETAIADLIDNSISANATEIHVKCIVTNQDSYVSIVDNGTGMDDQELLNAMKHGTAGPQQQRGKNDLGRFGLGLKTASFSQCRRLTVISSKNGKQYGVEWDLDLVSERDDWYISVLNKTQISDLPDANELGKNGTLVLWTSLDRLLEGETGKKRGELVAEKISLVDRHLALVFHRFIAGEVRGYKKLLITVNGSPVKPFDPFCRSNTNTQILPTEKVHIGDHEVLMKPSILPHHNKLSPSEYEFYQGRSDFLSNQGAYIYRNGRLMAWGDWFRLIPKGESTKLARIQIDFSSDLDEAWTIDIKKSRARPPLAVRDRLRQIIEKIAHRSTNTYKKRGERLQTEYASPVWERFYDSGRIRYALSESHPLIEKLKEQIGKEHQNLFRLTIEAISTSLPIETIYSDYCTHPNEMNQTIEDDDIKRRIHNLRTAIWGDGKVDLKSFREVLKSTNCFRNHNDAIEKYIQEEEL